MEKNRITDEDLNNKLDEIIDNVIKTGKENSKTLLDLIYERSIQTLGDLFDKNIEQFKQKIKERLSINEKTKP